MTMEESNTTEVDSKKEVLEEEATEDKDIWR